MNILAIIFVVLVVYSLNLPYTPAGLPWNDGFDASLVNYTPLAIVIPLIFGVWYLVSAKDRYQGPVRTLEDDEVTAGGLRSRWVTSSDRCVSSVSRTACCVGGGRVRRGVCAATGKFGEVSLVR